MTNDTIESASRQMEEGKNSTAELRKAIDRDAILEEAKKNELYSNMQELCQRMRVDIDGQLIDFFENEDVDLSNIAASIQKGMERIRNRINKSDPYLAFDEAGNFDEGRVREKIGKGQVPEALKQYVELEQKQEVEVKDIPKISIENLIKEGFTQKEDGTYELSEAWEKEFDDCRNKFEEIVNPFIEGAEEIDIPDVGKVKANKNYSKEFNMFYAIVDELTLLYKQKPIKDPEEFLLNVIIRLEKMNEFKAISFSGEEKRLYDELTRMTHDVMGQTLLKEQIGFDLGKLSDEQTLDASLFRYKTSKLESLRVAYEIKLKMIEERVEQVTAKGTLTSEEIEKKKKTLSEENERYKEENSIIYSLQFGLAVLERARENKQDIYENINARDFFVKNAFRKMKETYPEHINIAMESYSKNEEMDIYIDVIKDDFIKKRLDEPLDGLNEKRRHSLTFQKVAYALNGLKSDSIEVRNKSSEFLIEKYGDKIKNANINLVTAKEDNKWGTLVGIVLNDSLIEFDDMLSQRNITESSEFERFITKNLEAEMNGFIVGLSTAKEDIRRKNFELINSKEFKDEVSRRRDEKYSDFFNRKMFSLYKAEVEKHKYNEEYKSENFSDLDKAKYLRATIGMITLYSESPKKFEKDYVAKLKTVLIRYLPEAFDYKGEVDFDHIENYYNNFLQEHELNSDELSIDDQMDNFSVEIEKGIKEAELGTNPIKKFEKAELKDRNVFVLEKATEQIIEYMKLVKYIRMNLNENSPNNEAIYKVLDNIEKHNVSNLNARLNALENKEYTDDFKFSDFRQRIDDKVEKIQVRKCDDDKYYQIRRNTIKIFTEQTLKNFEENFGSLDKIEDVEAQKNIISVYLAIKEDIRDEIPQREKYEEIERNLKKYLHKVSPKLLNENNEINNEEMLNMYNNLFGVDEKNIENVSNICENDMLLDFLDNFSKQRVGNRSFPVDLLSGELWSEENYINGKLKEIRDKKYIIEDISLITDMYNGIARQYALDFKENEEIDLIKNLTVVINTLEGKNYSRQFANKNSSEMQELQRKMLDDATLNIKKYFSDVEKDDGTIDVEKLNEEVRMYLKIKAPEYCEKTGLGDSLDTDTFIGMIAIEQQKKSIDQEIVQKSLEKKGIEPVDENKSKKLEDLIDELRLSVANSEKRRNEEEFQNVFVLNVIKQIASNFEVNADGKNKRIEQYYREKVSWTDSKIQEEVNGIVIQESVIEQLSFVSADKAMEKVKKDFEEKKVDGQNIDSKQMIELAYIAIKMYEKNGRDSNELLEGTKRMLEDLVPGGIQEGRINDDVVCAKMNELRTSAEHEVDIEGFKKNAEHKFSTFMFTTFMAKRIDSRYTKVIRDIRSNSLNQEEKPIADEEMKDVIERIEEEMMVVNPGEKMAEEISNAEQDIPEISDEEARRAIEERTEEMEIGSPDEPVIESKDKQISDEEARPAFDKNAENVIVAEERAEEKNVAEEEQEGPKVGQEENRNAVVAESISVDEAVQEDKALVVQEKNVFKSLFNKVSFAMKNIVNNVKEKFGITSSSTESSNNDTTSTSSSSGGVDKNTQESSVKNLTGYDQIQIVTTMNKEKSEENDSPKREEATEERDDEIGG